MNFFRYPTELWKIFVSRPSWIFHHFFIFVVKSYSFVFMVKTTKTATHIIISLTQTRKNMQSAQENAAKSSLHVKHRCRGCIYTVYRHLHKIDYDWDNRKTIFGIFEVLLTFFLVAWCSIYEITTNWKHSSFLLEGKYWRGNFKRSLSIEQSFRLTSKKWDECKKRR
jgi:hypothetical protein